MRETFGSLPELAVWLEEQQRLRAGRASFCLSGQYTLPQLHQALDGMLPLVQRSSRRMVRDRSGYTVTMALWYRDGVRLADARRSGELSKLTAREQAALLQAEAIAGQCRKNSRENTLQALAEYVAAHITYEHAQPGTRRGSEVISCMTALQEGRANCQGISDLMALIGSLAGLDMGYRQGWNSHGPHLWNMVRLDGRMYALDVTRAAVSGCPFILMDSREAREQGLRWEEWVQAGMIAGS